MRVNLLGHKAVGVQAYKNPGRAGLGTPEGRYKQISTSAVSVWSRRLWVLKLQVHRHLLTAPDSGSNNSVLQATCSFDVTNHLPGCRCTSSYLQTYSCEGTVVRARSVLMRLNALVMD